LSFGKPAVSNASISFSSFFQIQAQTESPRKDITSKNGFDSSKYLHLEELSPKDR
jgi:hypothetical protein